MKKPLIMSFFCLFLIIFSNIAQSEEYKTHKGNLVTPEYAQNIINNLKKIGRDIPADVLSATRQDPYAIIEFLKSSSRVTNVSYDKLTQEERSKAEDLSLRRKAAEHGLTVEEYEQELSRYNKIYDIKSD